MHRFIAALCAAVLTLSALMPRMLAAADLPPIRIGVVYSYTGATPTAGLTLDATLAAWLDLHHQLVGGRKVEIIRRDDTGPHPDIAERQAQELVVAQHVDFLLGGLATPSAVAIERVSTAAKVPFFIMAASTNGILANAPYTYRFGATNAQVMVPLATWAAEHGIKTSYNLVADYTTGLQTESIFTDAFSARGGKVLGDTRVPLASSEFSAYVQRIKEAKPDAAFVFLISGSPAIGFFAASHSAQLKAGGMKIIVNPTIVDDVQLAAFGDEALGVISGATYTWTHQSPQNAAYLSAFHRVAPKGVENPDVMCEAAYDIMSAIDRVVAGQHGAALDIAKTSATLNGLKIDGPRGPIQIDAKTRELIENIYIRRVERYHGSLANIEFETIQNSPAEVPGTAR